MDRVTEVLEPDPVFVDSTGRRRRLAAAIGIAAGCLLIGCLAVVAFGLTTGSDVPLTPWPVHKPSHHAGLHLRPRSGPQVSRSRSRTRTSTPAPTATTRASTAPATRATSSPTATHPGRGLGRTKNPNSRKPG